MGMNEKKKEKLERTKKWDGNLRSIEKELRRKRNWDQIRRNTEKTFWKELIEIYGFQH